MAEIYSGEGFYPDTDWEIYPQVYHCDVATQNKGLSHPRRRHEPHFWVPDFIEGDEEAPDFICGGWPRKVVDIEEARDRH